MIEDVIQKIRAAEVAADRAPGSVRLVAVSKGHSLAQIRRHILASSQLQPGGFPLAENRGQELRDKLDQIRAEQDDTRGGQEHAPSQWPPLEWHFIGPVQRNKVKYLQAVTLIHTIETLEQAQAVAQAAQKWGHAPDVLLQRHNGEAQKHGAADEELPGLLRGVQEAGLRVRGLMVMAPYDDPDAAERVFADTARQAHDLGLSELSMGMSDDFEAAIRHGATLVRVGRRLFAEETHGNEAVNGEPADPAFGLH